MKISRWTSLELFALFFWSGTCAAIGAGLTNHDLRAEISRLQAAQRRDTTLGQLEASFYAQQKSCDEALDSAETLYGDCVELCRAAGDR